jgi:hypothetical protein
MDKRRTPEQVIAKRETDRAWRRNHPRHYTPEQIERHRQTSIEYYHRKKESPDEPRQVETPAIQISQPAAVRCHRRGCQFCAYRPDCTANVLMGGACLGESLLVGEVA